MAAQSDIERIAAKEVLAAMTLRELYENPAAPYEEDEVTRINIDGLNQRIYERIQNWTVSDLQEWRCPMRRMKARSAACREDLRLR